MACGLVESVLTNTVGTLLKDWVAEPVKVQLLYVRNYGENVEKFREKKEDLPMARERLQYEILESENQLLETLADVRALISKVDKTIEEMKSLEMEIEQNKKCFRWCPNLWWRYGLSKKLEKKTLPLISELLDTLAEHVKKERVGYRGPIFPTTRFLSESEDFQDSKASSEALKQINYALQDVNVSIIGLKGMGGVGKTSLMHKAGNQAIESKLFDKVVTVTVSRNPNFETIQDEIAKELPFKMNIEGERRPTKDLWLRLKKENRILIILDDVWSEIDLKKKVGIPVGEDPKACKVVLTTRRDQVCQSMNCQPTIELGYLDPHDAWKLFEKKADLYNSDDEDIKKVAAKVIKKCHGLPIAIVTLGSALKGKSLHIWQAAYRRLKTHRLDDIEGIENTEEKNAYLCLKTSFDFIKGEETKKCFLLCSLFPEDCEIYIEDLVRYAWGLELYKGFKTIIEVRSEVLAAIQHLKDSCLLLDAKENHVKMHDMVRDFALWISVNNRDVSFMIKSEVIGTWPNDEFQSYTSISLLITNRKAELPDELECPNLEILLLGGESIYSKQVGIPSEFFKGMKALKVCSLHHSNISMDAFDRLQIDLRSLHLNQCELPTISVLRKLKKLEILSFNQCEIIKLPDEIGDLNNLRMLDLSNCGNLERIPPNLISRLSKLEELYLGGCREIRWANDHNTIGQEYHASLAELSSLSDSIKVLFLEVSPEDIPKDFVFPELERFDICISTDKEDDQIGNGCKDEFENCKHSRSLKVEGSALHACKQLFRDLNSLGLNKLVGYQNLVPSFGLDHKIVFNKLTCLDLKWCKHMKYLIDGTKQEMLTTTAFPNLVKLSLSHMDDLEELCNGPHPQGFLQKLKIFYADCCDQMTAAIPVMQNLEEVVVGGSNEMQVIFEEEVNPANFLLPTAGVPPVFRNRSLQNLKVVEICGCSKLTYIFPASVAKSLGRLETLEISYCKELEEIIQKTEASNVCLQSLQRVVVEECHKLTSLSSLCHGRILENLEVLEIQNCDGLEYTFPTSMAEALPQLNVFHLENLPKLKGNDIVFTLPSLQELRVTCFPQLIPSILSTKIQVLCLTGKDWKADMEYLIGTDLVDHLFDSRYNLSTMKKFKLSYLYGLQVIWKGPIQVLNFENLTKLSIEECPRLRHVFSTAIAQSLQQLISLKIKNCDELEQIMEKLGQPQQQQSICFPNLTKIMVEDCSKLKTVFPVSVVHGLPKLEMLWIEQNSNLEQVFEDDAATTVNLLNQHKLIYLPQLLRLFLGGLPRLLTFIPMGYDFEVVLPSLEYLTVSECPNIITRFSVDSKNCGHIHAKTEPSPSVDNNTTWPIGSDIYWS